MTPKMLVALNAAFKSDVGLIYSVAGWEERLRSSSAYHSPTVVHALIKLGYMRQFGVGKGRHVVITNDGVAARRLAKKARERVRRSSARSVDG